MGDSFRREMLGTSMLVSLEGSTPRTYYQQSPCFLTGQSPCRFFAKLDPAVISFQVLPGVAYKWGAFFIDR